MSLGADARLVFDEASAGLLLREAGQKEPRKPLNVKLRHSGVGYYAILNRCEMGVVMDFEPVFPADQDLTVACAPTLPTPGPDAMPWSLAQARHPAAMAAARLNSIPSKTSPHSYNMPRLRCGGVSAFSFPVVLVHPILIGCPCPLLQVATLWACVRLWLGRCGSWQGTTA